MSFGVVNGVLKGVREGVLGVLDGVLKALLDVVMACFGSSPWRSTANWPTH